MKSINYAVIFVAGAVVGGGAMALLAQHASSSYVDALLFSQTHQHSVAAVSALSHGDTVGELVHRATAAGLNLDRSAVQGTLEWRVWHPLTLPLLESRLGAAPPPEYIRSVGYSLFRFAAALESAGDKQLANRAYELALQKIGWVDDADARRICGDRTSEH